MGYTQYGREAAYVATLTEPGPGEPQFRTLELPVPGIPPSLNRLLGMKYQSRFREKKMWREKAMLMACGLPRLRPPYSVHVRLEFRLRRRRDLDGHTASVKYLLDGLCPKVLADDDCEHVRHLSVEIASGCAENRTILTIREIEGVMPETPPPIQVRPPRGKNWKPGKPGRPPRAPILVEQETEDEENADAEGF